jgi:enolase
MKLRSCATGALVSWERAFLQAVENVNTILADAVKGIDVADQRAIDDAMLKADGTPNKSNVGANAILGSKFAPSGVRIPTYPLACLVS